MCMHAEGHNQNKLLPLGMMALAVANVGGYVMRRTMPKSIADPVSGFLLGVAIALMLIGIVSQRRAR